MTDAKALNSLADLICRAQKQGRRTPMGIAMAIDSARALPLSEKSELERLRQLVDAAPAELSEAQIEALAEAGNRFLNEENHEDLCLCDGWPEACVSGYTRSNWDSGAMEQALPAVIGLWESLRSEAEGRELRRLRARVAELEAERHTTNEALAELTESTRGGSPWQRATDGLNALVDAGIGFHIEPDGHIANPFGDEHIEWDRSAERWRLVLDEDDEPVPYVLTESIAPAVVTSAALAAAEKLRRTLALPGGERA